MKALVSLLTIFSLLHSCGVPEELTEFRTPLIGGSFKLKRYKESDVAASSYRVSGNGIYKFDSQYMYIGYTNFKESSFNTCTGIVKYTYKFITKAQADSLLNEVEDEEEAEDDGYSIFDPYLGNETEDNSSLDDDEDALTPEVYYLEGDLDDSSLNSSCPISHQDKVLYYLKLYPVGDLDIYNYNRRVFYDSEAL